MNRKKHEQNQENITGNCMETHTHTDKRKVKGTMTVMEAKRKGNKQCKENDRERKEREKCIKTSYLHGKWNDMVRVGRSVNV